MATFKCNEVAGTCDHEITADSKEEMMQKINEHAEEVHKDDMAKMSQSELDQKMGQIQTVVDSKFS